MRRRLDVAAALLHHPPVLFLDEPTTGLDPESRLGLWESVRALVRSGTTVLLTTQYLDEADALADQVVIIEAGRVADVGTPAQLKSRFAVGFRSSHRAGALLAALGLVVAFAYAVSWGFAALGLRVSDPEAAQAAGVPVMFLLVFTSCAFVPLSSMPGWLQAIGAHQPVNALVTAERALILGGPAAHDVLISLAWSAGVLLAFTLVSARTYARMGR
jgi:ABC-type Na+ efflux pump permease subunit